MTDARAEVAEVVDQAARRERTARRVYAAAVILALILGGFAVVISVASSRVSAEEVARQVAPTVTAAQIAESRGQRVRNARGVLEAANRALVGRGLPMVADPGPAANAEQISTAASTAQVLALLPEDVAQQLRDEDRGPVVVLPTADGTLVAPSEDEITGGTDRGQATDPGRATGPGQGAGAGPPSSGGESAPGTGTAPGMPAPAPGTSAAPAPAAPQQQPPPTSRRRLIPQILPLPLPLIGT